MIKLNLERTVRLVIGFLKAQETEELPRGRVKIAVGFADSSTWSQYLVADSQQCWSSTWLLAALAWRSLEDYSVGLLALLEALLVEIDSETCIFKYN